MSSSQDVSDELLEANEVANELRLHGADANIQNNAFESACQLSLNNNLLAASVSGDVETVNKLLRMGASVLSEDVYGSTGLHKSAGHGHDVIVKCYLDHEVDINIRGGEDCTPLIFAAWFGHLSIARLLTDR